MIHIFTARVRSTTGRYCFHRCLSVHRGGGEGGVSQGGRGGSAGGRGGSAGGEGWVSQGGGQLGGRGGSAGGEGWVSRGEGWVSRGGGVGQRGGEGWVSGGEGGSAKIEQHREYLLHGGRYASCVHAGGLSCSVLFLKKKRKLVNECYNSLWFTTDICKRLPATPGISF